MKRFTVWIKRHPQELRRFAKFLIVGVSSTLIDVGMFAMVDASEYGGTSGSGTLYQCVGS